MDAAQALLVEVGGRGSGVGDRSRMDELGAGSGFEKCFRAVVSWQHMRGLRGIFVLKTVKMDEVNSYNLEQTCSGHSNQHRRCLEVFFGISTCVKSDIDFADRPRKIPWRLSSPQKLRHRRRMRRVDNVISVLDSALQREAQPAFAPTQASILARLPTAALPTPESRQGAGEATPEELSTTAEGQRMLSEQANADQNQQRHGRGPRQGDIATGTMPSGRIKTLGDEARAHGTIKLIERWKAEMPTEAEMLPRDKYTIFDRKAKHYRKGVHSKLAIRRLSWS